MMEMFHSRRPERLGLSRVPAHSLIPGIVLLVHSQT
jgi:hypothetical protein